MGNKSNYRRKKITGIISTILLVFSVFVLIMTAIFVYTGSGDKYIMGYKPFIVATGSMEPNYMTHCVVIVEKDDYKDVKINDVIAFIPEEFGAVALHRVVENTPQGFITKGDNNEYADEGYVTKDNYVGHSVWYTNSFAGYITRLMEPKGVIMFLVIPVLGVVLFIVAIGLLWSIWKNRTRRTHVSSHDENV